ncbi:MazG nucleotide pyrophosphohydrolase [Kutzneria sp. 744]|nr:MazG nucleotide pyrophosphohydrolase [Kutzneria sp. 744]
MDINTGNLRDLARVISENLRANGFPAEGAANRQVLAVAEECGEFVGAYRRWSGQARRTGTAEELRAELADVVITAFVAAEELGIDLDQAITEKAGVVLTRGWREQTSPR